MPKASNIGLCKIKAIADEKLRTGERLDLIGARHGVTSNQISCLIQTEQWRRIYKELEEKYLSNPELLDTPTPPMLQLSAKGGQVTCRYALKAEIDGIVYIADRADSLATLLLRDAKMLEVNPEQWKDGIRREIASIEKAMSDIPADEWDPDTGTKRGIRIMDEYRDAVECLQSLEAEYPEGILEQAPWKSGKILYLKNHLTGEAEEMSVEEFKQSDKRRRTG